MLEIKHLTKVYKTKGGAETKALDDVSIRFEEKGLVFLLGKSGSGKSTLLNVAGGLDEPTSGEVVVMGKSSREFSGSDFDSYRNTYVGFIFQEYNVLNEFNVEDNVALALELQGKPKDKEAIASLLRQVELEAYAKRKPNTLSGGQKQRIAIARALIKDPQIIMADEPTGALDSATGKQVFDTLKKLSETRLVIVVSHDREFAEIYGDRIVELKDGKIISDVTKVKAPAEQLSENVTKIGEDTLSIKSGATLTEENLKAIRKFVAEAKGDVIISKGQSEIANFKKANRIDESGSRERFDDTQEEKLNVKTYEKGEAKFIRSRLPASKAVKIGASGLKLKPIRLIFTVLLSLVAFVMFGLFSTMMVYDADEVSKNSFINSDYEYLAIEKNYRSHETFVWSENDRSEYDNYYNTAYFTPAEAERFHGFGAFGIYESIGNVSFTTDVTSYYRLNLTHAAFIPEGNELLDTLQGTYPANSNEICISSFVFESFRNGSYRIMDENGDFSDAVPVNSAQQILNTYISLSGKAYKITGIFNSGNVPQKYSELKTSGGNGSLSYEYSNYMYDSLHTCILVSKDYKATGKEEYINYFDYAQSSIGLRDKYGNDFLYTSEVQVYGKEGPSLPVTFFNQTTPPASLGKNELVVSLETLYSPLTSDYEAQRGNINNSILEKQEELNQSQAELERLRSDENAVQSEIDLLESKIEALNSEMEGLNAEYTRVSDLINDLYTYFTIIRAGEYQIYNEETNEWIWKTATAEEISEAKAAVLEILEQSDLNMTCLLDGSEIGTYTVVGYYYVDNTDFSYNGIYCSQSLYDAAGVYTDGGVQTSETNYVAEKDAVYECLFVPFDRTEQSYDAIFSLLGEEKINPETDVWYLLNNPLYNNIEMINAMVKNLSILFLIVGIVMALFAALLLFNFISVSISNKKKDIGILRAVGARGVDVFKIFFSESGIIVGICTVLSIIGTIVLVGVLNNVLKAEIGLEVTIFVFGWLSVAMMIGIAIVVALIATFLPVYFAARRKPVESIRAL